VRRVGGGGARGGGATVRRIAFSKLTSVFNACVLLLIINFVITLSKLL